jgi:hypothetical protein
MVPQRKMKLPMTTMFAAISEIIVMVKGWMIEGGRRVSQEKGQSGGGGRLTFDQRPGG